MYHHYNSNCRIFRFCSICSSCCCFASIKGCGACLTQMGDDSWQHVSSWTEVHNTRTGALVSSDHGDQQGYQACGHLCVLAMMMIAQAIFLGSSGICWLASSPGFLCGDGMVPEELWQERCSTLREVYFRIDPPRYKCGYQSCCETCIFSQYQADSPKCHTELKAIKYAKRDQVAKEEIQSEDLLDSDHQ